MSVEHDRPPDSNVAVREASAIVAAKTGAGAAAKTNPSAAIETRGLTKRYGSMIAVDHLDLRVERGEIFGFLGPNGAGKTTTMRMLLGLIQPTSGEASVLGLDIRHHLPQILRQTGAIIENPTFYPYLSGRDNLRAVAKLTRTTESRIPEVLALVDLSTAADKSFKTYSLGMKQRLAVGAALLHSPDLLILDEPANGLDPAGIVEMRDLMKQLKGEGHSVMISSHVLHEIEQICDRIVIMNIGKIVVQGRVEDLLGNADVLELRVERPEEAERVLQLQPWIGAVSRDEDHLTIEVSPSRAAEVTRTLADHELYVSELRRPERSLEQYFLDVTGDKR